MWRRGLTTVLLAALATLAAGPSAAQAGYPNRPITLIVPFGPGGIADITARSVAQAMSVALKQAIVVDNRPSAGSIVGSAAVAKAAPDGYTLLLMSNGNAVSASLFKTLPYDMGRDFAPIATLGYFDLALFVNAGSRFKNVADLLAFARANPGKLTLGSITAGSTQNLATELFKTTTGIDAVIVPYKGTPAVVTALRAGEIDAGFEILGPMVGQVNATAIRALAVTSDQRFAALPEVPTMQQAGVANYSVASWNALAAPAGTPAEVIARLNVAANAALASPAVQERLLAVGVRPQGSTPGQLRTLLANETKRWGAVMRKAKIEVQ
ncbi:MAG: tripartite tricarboxylate transporter substrate binding protein [Bacteriovorax sp.]|nr:tripartite tricarboxylate transporter substrate binding protein [Rhizobacter sp.]